MMHQHTNIYVLSGLGVDRRVFDQYHFCESYTVHHIEWKMPEHESISLAEYSNNLFQNIDTQDSILIGLSFGGMVAIEAMQQFPFKLVILISSIPDAV